MWHRDDSINLNGAISFMAQEDALKVLEQIKKLFLLEVGLDKNFNEQKGINLWTIDFCNSHVNPLFKNILANVSYSYKCYGTLTYIFNTRLETGVLVNGDLNGFYPRDLIAFAVEKLGIHEDQIKSSDYDKIKQSWFFHVWSLSNGNTN